MFCSQGVTVQIRCFRPDVFCSQVVTVQIRRFRPDVFCSQGVTVQIRCVLFTQPQLFGPWDRFTKFKTSLGKLYIAKQNLLFCQNSTIHCPITEHTISTTPVTISRYFPVLLAVCKHSRLRIKIDFKEHNRS